MFSVYYRYKKDRQGLLLSGLGWWEAEKYLRVLSIQTLKKHGGKTDNYERTSKALHVLKTSRLLMDTHLTTTIGVHMMKRETRHWYERPTGIILLNIVAGLIVVMVCGLVV